MQDRTAKLRLCKMGAEKSSLGVLAVSGEMDCCGVRHDDDIGIVWLLTGDMAGMVKSRLTAHSYSLRTGQIPETDKQHPSHALLSEMDQKERKWKERHYQMEKNQIKCSKIIHRATR